MLLAAYCFAVLSFVCVSRFLGLSLSLVFWLEMPVSSSRPVCLSVSLFEAVSLSSPRGICALAVAEGRARGRAAREHGSTGRAGAKEASPAPSYCQNNRRSISDSRNNAMHACGAHTMAVPVRIDPQRAQPGPAGHTHLHLDLAIHAASRRLSSVRQARHQVLGGTLGACAAPPPGI